MISDVTMVTDYGGHNWTLLPVWEINLKTCISGLICITWHTEAVDCVPSWRMYAGHRRWPSLRSADSRTCVVKRSRNQFGDRSFATVPPVQRCGTVCLNSFGNQTSPLDDLNDRLKRLCLVSPVAAACAWTLRALTRNLSLLTYLLSYLHAMLVTSVCSVITVTCLPGARSLHR